MDKKRLIIFDLDGTLCDSLADLTDATNEVRRHFQLQDLSPSQVRLLVGEGARNLIKGALPGLSEDAIDDGLNIFLAYNIAHIADKTRLYAGVREALDVLKAQGRQLAVVSNKTEELCRQLLALLGVDHLFFTVIGGDTLPFRKPAPDQLLKAMSDAGVSAAETAMVGDSIYDVAAGKAAAVTTVACTYGYGNSSEISEADFRIDNFQGLLELPL